MVEGLTNVVEALPVKSRTFLLKGKIKEISDFSKFRIAK